MGTGRVQVHWLLLLASALTTQACFEYSSAIPNPCLKKECPFGAECIASFDGRVAECVCPTKCRSYGDSQGSRPVCGSDGRDYANLCELNRHACSLVKTVTVRYNGSCDPCYGVKCPDSQICQIDDQRNPICKCNAACGKEFEPVCGSNGQTYVNECVLRVEACKTRKPLRILHKGICSEANSCNSLQCSIYQECEVNRFGIPECHCPTICNKVLKPVCGTDGETYDSECELYRQACLSHRNITIRYMGVCDPESFCHQNHGTCKFGSVCLSLGPKYTCICTQCSEEYSPVCGSNGITYTNICNFRLDMCQKKMSNVTIRQGSCAGCENINCMFYSYCEVNTGTAKCTCPQHCEKISEPVCGSDMVTYPNECELRVNSCKKKKYIVPIKRGPCSSCQDVNCDYGARCENGVCVCPNLRKCPSFLEPVCGSDNVTYDNECKLMAASCESITQISVKSKGTCEDSGTILAGGSGTFGKPCLVNTCKYGGICVVDEKFGHQCLCKFNCSSSYSANALRQPICGSDGRVYPNECAFREEMCNRQQEIKPVEAIYCEKYRNIPCEGEPPLLDAVTRKEYNCSEDRQCPDQSYCHRGLNFAKCCRELDLEDCYDSAYGCCPDEKTPSFGPNYGGCPSTCQCNRLGSYLSRCDPVTKQCFCKPGISGMKCDRCEAGYWGLHKISEGNAGCIPCQCNKVGASRHDCEQMTGRCICKSGFLGYKCDICADGSPVESYGCVRVESISCNSDSSKCKFGATCRNGQCRCDIDCSESEKAPVCSSDGSIFDSECLLKLWSCKAQKHLAVVNAEKCRPSTKNSATTSPVRRSTEYQNYDKYTQKVNSENTGDVALGTGPTMPTLHWDSESEQMPFFGGDAFIEMNTLQAYSKVAIQVELIAYEADGVILFNAQTSTGEGDYIALLLKKNFVEFRYNLGSGSVVLRSAQPILLGQNVKIDLRRHLSEGFLSVDGLENVTGKSEGPHKLLDLGQSLFIGGTPYTEVKKVFDIIGTKKNFTGCLRSLRINEQLMNLEPSASSVLSHVQLDSCSQQKCSQTFCQNGGSCVQNDRQYTCLCLPSFTGSRCQHQSQTCLGTDCPDASLAHSIDIWDFWNGSYVELPTLQGVSQAFTLEVWLMARSPNGVILYNGQSKGDFVELALMDGFVHYSFNLGGQSNKSGIMSIKSRSRLSMGEWHRVVAARNVKEGTLQINDEPAITDIAKGNLNELNLDEPLYLGGIGEKTKRSNREGSYFNGAIQRIMLNGILWRNIQSRASKIVNIQNYEGPPCGYDNPCANQGKCIAWLNDFMCRCTDEFHGALCERAVDLKEKPVKLDNSYFVEYNTNNFPHSKQQQNVIEIMLHTTSANGMIVWTSKDTRTITDYLAIGLVDGFLEFSFDLGQNTATIRSSSRIDDGETHHIIVTRNKQVAFVQIDHTFLNSTVSEKGATDLNTDGKLWIGGFSNLPPGLPDAYYRPFSGCLLAILIDGVALDLSNLTGELISKC